VGQEHSGVLDKIRRMLEGHVKDLQDRQNGSEEMALKSGKKVLSWRRRYTDYLLRF